MNLPQKRSRARDMLLLASCALCATQACAQGAMVHEDGYASTGGCDPVSNNPPAFILQDAGDVMRERHVASVSAVAPSGNWALYEGSVKLGKIWPFRARARAVDTRGCTQQQAQAVTAFRFDDVIDVTAGSHAEGTPVTYTATVRLPVNLQGRGTRCGVNSTFSGMLWINDQLARWQTSGPYEGAQDLVVSAVVRVGDRMRFGLSTDATVSAVRYSGSDNICAYNEVALTEAARIALTADTLGANTTSINGVRYQPRP